MRDTTKNGNALFQKLEGLLKVTAEDIQRVSSEVINETILNAESTGKRGYVGGEFIIECVDDKNFTCSYNLYFQDEQENFFKETARTGKRSLTSLESEFRDELTTEKVIKFEIPEPDDEARAEYERNKKVKTK